MAGSLGSLFGLNPYSSTSFLRSSSASFRCFLLRHKNRAASTINATAATGTTTATAIFPPGERPPESFDASAPKVARAAAPDEDEECFDVVLCGVPVDATKTDAVRVLRTVCSSVEPPTLPGLTVITEVNSITVGVDDVMGGVEASGVEETMESVEDDCDTEEMVDGGGLELGVRAGKENDVEVDVKEGLVNDTIDRQQGPKNAVRTRRFTSRIDHVEKASPEAETIRGVTSFYRQSNDI